MRRGCLTAFANKFSCHVKRQFRAAAVNGLGFMKKYSLAPIFNSVAIKAEQILYANLICFPRTTDIINGGQNISIYTSRLRINT